MGTRSSFIFACALQVGDFTLGAPCGNGRFFHRKKERTIMNLLHVLCCVRAQHRNRMNRLGSNRTFSALPTNDRNGPFAE